MQNVPIQFTSGLDRSKAPLRADPGSLYTLKGFRQRPSSFGVLEQTPYYYQLLQQSQGTYYNGGSVTENTTSRIVARIPDPAGSGTFFILSDFIARDGGATQLQSFSQTSVPAANTINTQCFIVINNIAAFALALGGTINIVISAAATFTWAKNIDPPSAPLACTTTGTAIDGGNATVYFMTTGGFSINDTWTWTRTDAIYDIGASQTTGNPIQHESFNGECFFISNTARLRKIAYDGSGVSYVITGGYRPIYGLGLTVYYGHLVVIAAATTTNATVSSRAITWSDNIDINAFFSTDTNEADTYSVPRTGPNAVLGGVGSILRGVFVWHNTLFVLSADRVYYSNYLGLPIVFSFAVFRDFQAGTFTAGANYSGDVCVASGSSKYVYLVSGSFIFSFDGANLVLISDQLRGTSAAVPSSSGQTSGCYPLSIHYVPLTRELYVRDAYSVLHVYQEDFGTWYTRYADFFSPTGIVSCIDCTGAVGIKSRKVLSSDINAAGSGTPLKDDGAGVSFGVPTITTQVLTGGNFVKSKEISGLYLTANFVSGISSTYYSTGTDCVVAVKWYICDGGQIIGSPTSEATNKLTSASINGVLSFPRVSFRGLALQIELNGLVSGKPPALVQIAQLDLNAISWPQPPATR